MQERRRHGKGTFKSPFPVTYFGGKSKVSSVVWNALGDVKHYIEPFFGSGAVLLSRPNYTAGQHVETICDKDGFVCNVWRALQFNPDEVAKWCDWPVNHADLSARKKELIKNEDRLLQNLIDNPEWYDAKLAGYWIWAASCWIGSGLTRLGQIPHVSDGGKGVHTLGQIPHVSNGGKGVHTLGQIPHVSNGGKGVHTLGKRPHVSDGGKGVHTLGQRPHVGNGGQGVQEPYNTNTYNWFRQLSERLRHVRVVCGDWTRVCGGQWQDKTGTVGMFFDPPYGVEDRDTAVYHHDSTDVAKDVVAWVKDRGSKKTYRIVLAGYEEYEELLSMGWTKQKWSANGGYSNSSKGTNENKHRETLYFSPYCIGQKQLFKL